MIFNYLEFLKNVTTLLKYDLHTPTKPILISSDNIPRYSDNTEVPGDIGIKSLLCTPARFS